MVLAEVPYSSCVYLPCGVCCHCCVTPAASLTHKEELRRRGGVECVEARDKQKTTSTAWHCSSQQMDEASALSQFGALLVLWYSGRGSEKQILYCYVMNIFPPRPDSAKKAVSSVQRLIIGHSSYQLRLACKITPFPSYHLGRRICNVEGSSLRNEWK